MMKLLALDFDGVISDSAPEAFLVALRSYTAMRPDSRLLTDLERISGAGCPRPDRVRGDPLYRDFIDLMPLGNRAEDYAVMLAALEGGVLLPDQMAYHEHRRTQAPEFLEAFHRRFYQLRHAFARDDPEGWRGLMGPYPRLLEMLRRRRDDAAMAIATAKDRQSVALLLRDYGIDDLFPDASVLDKETGVSKRAHLEQLQRRLGVAYAEITFVDDKLNHLDDAAGMGVRCALAAWGYNGSREREQALRRGYLVCTLESAESRIFS
jgi:phosphoglycolate phosphatase-like HAD superfamily hydrolase